jgi:hypothetical protein
LAPFRTIKNDQSVLKEGNLGSAQQLIDNDTPLTFGKLLRVASTPATVCL